MSQHGVTFLEVIVVIAILMIVTSLVSPSLGDWRQRRDLENDFHAVLSKIDYIKTRVRVVNGTAALNCATGNPGSVLSYKIYSPSQVDYQDPSSLSVIETSEPNILSGKTKITFLNAPSACPPVAGIFISSGQSNLKDGSGPIDFSIEPNTGIERFGSYRVLVNPTVGFITKYKCIGAEKDIAKCPEIK